MNMRPYESGDNFTPEYLPDPLLNLWYEKLGVKTKEEKKIVQELFMETRHNIEIALEAHRKEGQDRNIVN